MQTTFLKNYLKGKDIEPLTNEEEIREFIHLFTWKEINKQQLKQKEMKDDKSRVNLSDFQSPVLKNFLQNNIKLEELVHSLTQSKTPTASLIENMLLEGISKWKLTISTNYHSPRIIENLKFLGFRYLARGNSIECHMTFNQFAEILLQIDAIIGIFKECELNAYFDGKLVLNHKLILGLLSAFPEESEERKESKRRF